MYIVGSCWWFRIIAVRCYHGHHARIQSSLHVHFENRIPKLPADLFLVLCHLSQMVRVLMQSHLHRHSDQRAGRDPYNIRPNAIDLPRKKEKEMNLNPFDS